ncbi:hypothetical protein [Parasphingorhabdus pacifica]
MEIHAPTTISTNTCAYREGTTTAAEAAEGPRVSSKSPQRIYGLRAYADSASARLPYHGQVGSLVNLLP